jgi:hypothetical protein
MMSQGVRAVVVCPSSSLRLHDTEKLFPTGNGERLAAGNGPKDSTELSGSKPPSGRRVQAEVEDLHPAVVGVQRRQRFGLLLKPAQPIGIGSEGFGEYFEGDVAVQAGIVSGDLIPHFVLHFEQANFRQSAGQRS